MRDGGGLGARTRQGRRRIAVWSGCVSDDDVVARALPSPPTNAVIKETANLQT